ncbi:DivIVA domain-containing protein [Nocardioides sp.]|uniref:DivIVA domain-containing protein n=1 Tax=Nocardioides sp. TaxID=35761 RepID=UPI002D7EBB40|nr:DivIVA domain-containing protein [Nocardioides sp.]HET8959218.1 DivIVA domain-containing protein [Nocardioides sp.]
MTDHDEQHARHLTPDSLRERTFRRRMVGLDADEVYAYLDLLADQIQTCDTEREALRADNSRLQAEVERMRTELAEQEPMEDRVNEQVVQLFSQAQLVAEEMVEDVSRDARERLGQARAHERQIVEKALDAAGEQVREYALSAQAKMRSVMESFADDVDRLGIPAAREAARASSARDPLFDDMNEWQASVRNGRGPGHPRSAD